MPEQKTVKLKTGFEIAHGRLEEIKEQIKKAYLAPCSEVTALFKVAADPEHEIDNRPVFLKLRRCNLVTDEGKIANEELRHVVLSAAGFESLESALERAREQSRTCQALNLENLTAD